jgi:hypothetical protein
VFHANKHLPYWDEFHFFFAMTRTSKKQKLNDAPQAYEFEFSLEDLNVGTSHVHLERTSLDGRRVHQARDVVPTTRHLQDTTPIVDTSFLLNDDHAEISLEDDANEILKPRAKRYLSSVSNLRHCLRNLMTEPT